MRSIATLCLSWLCFTGLCLAPLTVVAQPANDACGSATVVTGGVPVAFDNTLATLDGPDPACSAGASDVDVWFTYTPPLGIGSIDVSVCGATFDTILTVYDDACPPTSEVGCNDDACGPAGLQSQLTDVPVVAGETYLVRVGGWSSTQQGPGQLTITEQLAPPTDVVCSTNGDLFTVFFDWPAIAQSGDTVLLSTSEPGAPSPLISLNYPVSFYTGTLQPANQGSQLPVTFTLVYTSTTMGSSTATCGTVFNVAPGELCANAIDLGVGSGSGAVIGAFNNTGATTDGPAVTCGLGQVEQDRWFRYEVGPGVDLMRLSVCGFGFDTMMAAYTGDCAAPTQVDCDDNGCPTGDGSQLEFPVNPGETYFVRVGSWTATGATGAAEVTITEGSVPDNDLCANAITLAAPTDVVPIDTNFAETDGSGCEADHDVWYLYTPVGMTNEITISTCNSDFDTTLAVYEGSSCILGTALACNDDACGTQSQIQLPVSPGVTYLIRVGGSQGSRGLGELVVQPSQYPITDLVCTTTGDSWSGTWTYPASAQLGDTIEIFSDEPTAVNPVTTISYPDPLPPGQLLAVNAGMALAVTFDFVFNGAAGSATTSCTAVFNPPPGDECALPIDIGTGNQDAVVDLAAALQGSAVAPPCNVVTEFNEDWYLQWTANTSSAATLQFEITVDSDVVVDPVIAVYESCADVGAGNPLPNGCNDGGGASSVTVEVNSGQTYLIRIADGAPSMLGDCAVTIRGIQEPVSNLTCTSSMPDTTELSWDNPASGESGDTILIYSDEPGATNPVATLGWPATSTSLPLVTAGQQTVVTYSLEYFSLDFGTSPQERCTVGVNPPANDTCASAIDLGSGGFVSMPFNTTAATTDGLDPVSVCNTFPGWNLGDVEGDVWFRYTAGAGTTALDFSLCNSVGGLEDTTLVIYEDNGMCPPPDGQIIACDNDGCGGDSLLSKVIATVIPGTSYLIRIGSFSEDEFGHGMLEIGPPCEQVSDVAVEFDCVSEVVTLSWTDSVAYSSIEVRANGTPIMAAVSPVGADNPNSVIDSPPTNSVIIYEIRATCANGGVGVTLVEVLTTVPSGSDNLILHLESPDDVDSGLALEAALLANNATVSRITDWRNDCLSDFIDQAANVWVLLGTYDDNRPLRPMLARQLYDAAQQDGVNIYLEGGDHWEDGNETFLDRIDGVRSHDDGDDSLTQLQASSAGTAMLDLGAAFPNPIGYAQAQMDDIDYNEQLELAVPVTEEVDITSAEVIWRNAPDMGSETDYIVGIVAITTSSAKVISCSFEFGGFTGDQNALAQRYLSFFTGGSTGDPQFQRGDCNDDGGKNIADAVRLLNFLFPGMGPPVTLTCDDACDANDDGGLNIADAVAILNVLFPSGPPIPWLAPDTCGVDPTSDGLDCASYSMCP